MPTPHETNPLLIDEPQESATDALRGVVRFVRVLRRRRRVVGAIVAGAFTVGLAYYVLAPRQYASVAKVMIEQQSPDHDSSGRDRQHLETIMASQRELVRSAKVVQAAIAALPAEHRTDLAGLAPRDWVGEITDRLSATTVRKTDHMEVACRSADPEAASAIVTAVIDAYIHFVEKNHRTGAADSLASLTADRDRLNRQLVVKQQELQVFRQQIGHLAMQPHDGVLEPIINRAVKLNDAVIAAQTRRLDLEASLATVRRAIRSGEDLRRHVSAIEEVVGQQMLLSTLGIGSQDLELQADQQKKLLAAEAELRRIAPYLGETHPKTVALRQQVAAIRQYLGSYAAGASRRFDPLSNQELGPLLEQTLSQSVVQAAGRERQLQSSFEAARAEALRQSGNLSRLQMLEREVDRIERQHDVLFEKIAKLDLHQFQSPIRVIPVEDPLPNEQPVWPSLPLSLLGAIGGGLALAAGVVYAQDLLDDRFGSPEEMASQLGAPVLALVRTMTPTGGVGIDAVHMHAGGDDTELEAFRTLRTSLALAGESSDRLIISSAEPSDGKTTVSANLSASFAQVGKRTLVIDADMRRPGMTALMDMKGQPGLTDLLLAEPGGVAELADRVVRATGEAGLDVISAGPRRPNPAELLAGENFPDLLAWADSRYDQVLIDCPPVLAVSDAQIVGRLVDGVVLVTCPAKNHRRLVARACESFTSAGVRLLGLVANRVSDEHGSGYGYGYGYGYSYTDDEPEEPVDGARPTDGVGQAAGTGNTGGAPPAKEPMAGGWADFTRAARNTDQAGAGGDSRKVA